MIRHEADSDAKLRQDERFLLWAKEENRGDEGVLRAVVSRFGQTEPHRKDHALDSLLDRDSWNVSDEVFKSVLTEEESATRSGGSVEDGQLAAYAQLFPSDSLSITAYRNLETWFTSPPEERGPRRWESTLAIAFGVAPPQDLPALAARAHTRFRFSIFDLHLPMFTKPLMRRLRTDPDAVEAFKEALSNPAGLRNECPIMAGSWDEITDAHLELQPLQRRYLFALVLRHAGALPQIEAAETTRVLVSASPDTVVHNPFTDHEGPLCLAVLDLAAR
ncbi:hypothetical protein ACUN22_07835 [Streptomyces anulatus]|uniref:hypothetical protein n=1 Tax=Streptomyces anulatus TaxID=1892 RepID=UPI00403D74B8